MAPPTTTATTSISTGQSGVGFAIAINMLSLRILFHQYVLICTPLQIARVIVIIGQYLTCTKYVSVYSWAWMALCAGETGCLLRCRVKSL
ncbi:hypothetical protein BDD12DRAFT_125781 [Trichophaea hybrida]|nr:hypothetical protein BDD12DRAFT_125781 [Trichophaea hybrida]